MKFRISLLLLTFALAASSTLTAFASACSNLTIQGTYAFTLHGTIFLPDSSTLLLDGIAKQTYDGRGNLTQLDAVATNGNMVPGWRPGTGTYSVNPDCTGTLLRLPVSLTRGEQLNVISLGITTPEQFWGAGADVLARAFSKSRVTYIEKFRPAGTAARRE